MTQPKLRFAIIGLDHWYTAINFAEMFSNHDRVELVGIADSNIERAREVAAKVGITEFTSDLQKYIVDESIHAIGSFVTVDQNPSVVIPAAQAGKHIISVKPLARTLAEASEIVDAVNQAGVTFIPAETLSRQSDLNQHLKSLYDSNSLGDIVSGNLTLISSLPQNWPGAPADGGWWAKPEHVPGGGWIDHSIYQIDRLRWILGKKVARVTGRTANLIHKELAVEDYGHAIVEFEDGSTFAIEDTWSGPAGSWRITTTLVGTSGAIHTDTVSGEFSSFGLNGESKWVSEPMPPDDTGLVDQIVDHLQRLGNASYGSVEDGWENLAVCIAFYESAATQQPVTVKHL